MIKSLDYDSGLFNMKGVGKKSNTRTERERETGGNIKTGRANNDNPGRIVRDVERKKIYHKMGSRWTSLSIQKRLWLTLYDDWLGKSVDALTTGPSANESL